MNPTLEHSSGTSERVLSVPEQAESCFWDGRLAEAYTHFRRYFDRMPFRLEEGHTRYMGMFVRVLMELGKIQDLRFYVPILERHLQKNPSAHIAFALGHVYRFKKEPKIVEAKRLFEEVVKHTTPGTELNVKAKMVLASIYEEFDRDICACEALINSIEPPEDIHLWGYWITWKAVIAKQKGNRPKARELLMELYSRINFNNSWYAFYCAKVVQGGLEVEEENIEEARRLVEEVRSIYHQRRYKSLKAKLEWLEGKISQHNKIGTMQIRWHQRHAEVLYNSALMRVSRSSIAARLLELFQTGKLYSKEEIAEFIYHRAYQGESDDKLVYYHVHALRQKLIRIGAPKDAISSQKGHYRLEPKVN